MFGLGQQSVRHGVMVVSLFALAPGCRTLPYQPETVRVPSDAAAFALLTRVVRVRFPRLVVCDPAQRRLQSDWVDASDSVVPGRRRVTVFPSGDDCMGLVVELSWLRMRSDATPYWTPPVGDATAERELAAAVRAALADEVSRSR